MPTLFYDVTEISRLDRKTGIQRVTRELFSALKRLLPKVWLLEPVIGSMEDGAYYPAIELNGLFFIDAMKTSPVKTCKDDVFLGVDLNYKINDRLVSGLLNERQKGVRIYFVVYDIFPLVRPELFNCEDSWFDGEDFVAHFKHWLISICLVSDVLIGVSSTTMCETRQWIEANWEQIGHAPEIRSFRLGISSRLKKAKQEIKTEVTNIFLVGPTFLMVGTLEPRKGHALVLDAFDSLWERDKSYQLVIVGKPGWRSEDLVTRIRSHPNFGRYLFFLEAATDEELAYCYRRAEALLSMSEAEGFGLPNVEAASFGLPIIARDISIFREVCGIGAYYIPVGADAEILADEIDNWQQLKHEGKAPLSRDIEVITWEQSARQLLEAIGLEFAIQND